MNILLTILIFSLLLIAYELWELIKLLKRYLQANDTYLNLSSSSGYDLSSPDPLLEKATQITKEFDKVSASLLQRRLGVGYARAAKILDQLEENRVVGPARGVMPREVLKK